MAAATTAATASELVAAASAGIDCGTAGGSKAVVAEGSCDGADGEAVAVAAVVGLALALSLAIAEAVVVAEAVVRYSNFNP